VGATAAGANAAGATEAVRVGPLEGVRVPLRPPPAPPGHRQPIWADEHLAAEPRTITTSPTTAAPVPTPDAGDGEVDDG
jgi:hypothetical protein